MQEYWFIEPLNTVLSNFDMACLIAIENGFYPKEAVFPISKEEYEEWLSDNA